MNFPKHYFAVFISAILLLISSCKKNDVSNLDINSKSQTELAKLFLKEPVNTNSIFSKILNVIKNQDLGYHFLNTLALKEGLPIWKGAKILISNSSSNTKIKSNAALVNGRTAGNDTIVLVPLVLKDSLNVTGFLTCDVTSDTVLIKLIRAREYKKYSFSNATDTITANAIALQFMTFQNNIFGDSTFLIKDSRLFNYKTPSGALIKTKYLTIRSPLNTQGMDYSITYEACYNVVHDGNKGELVGVAPGETADYPYAETFCFPVTIWYSSPTGGGGSSGSTTPSDPNAGGTGWYDGGTTDPCVTGATSVDATGCDPGWVPTISLYSLPMPAFIWEYPGDDGTSFSDPDPSLQPDFYFDPADNYESLYPRFTNIVKNLKDFVKNSPEVMSALQRYSGFTKTKILQLLSYGKGPTIKIEEMGGKFGFYDKDSGINVLHLRASYVRGLETAYLEYTKRGTAFLLGITILHEFVHYGRQINGMQAGVFNFEAGSIFERDAIGVIIDELNANKISIRYEKYF